MASSIALRRAATAASNGLWSFPRSRDHSTPTLRCRSSGFFSDVFDPIVPTRSLRQVLNLMDHLTDNPLLSSSRGNGSSSHRGRDVQEDAEAREGAREGHGGGEHPDYQGGGPNLFRLGEIKAEMKNGVLKVKEGERKDAFQVKFE